MSTDVVRTEEPVLTDGIPSVAFFNGRLLTGEDLTREQLATTEARLRVGRALGSGVVCGLGVTLKPSSDRDRPVVAVEPGRAVNARGAVLELSGAIDVALTRESASGSGPEPVFTDCRPLQPGTYVAGVGAYVLTVEPARRGVGRAAVSGLEDARAQCNVAYSLEGVQFSLLRVALPAEALADPDRTRNRVAHLMAGTSSAERAAALVDPLAPPPVRYGLLDDLVAAGCLTPDQVPLAFLLWTGSGGVLFVDPWAVRRRVHVRHTDGRSTVTGDRARVDAQAVFDQFQDQLADLVRQETPQARLSAEKAAKRFDHLPPVGIVPIAAGAGTGGYDPDLFLGAQGSADLATLDADALRALVLEGLDHTPFAVGGDVRVQRYLLWENEQARAVGVPVRRVMVIAREGIPYRGVARYGAARHSLGRYAPSVV